MDGYSGYNQVKMGEKNQEKIAFILEWKAYAYNVMPFDLCNALATFQKVVTKAFNKYFNDFMQVFFDEFNVFGKIMPIWSKYKNVYMNICWVNGINLNLEKYMFYVNSRILLGHIVCKEGLLVDPRKITVITSILKLTNVTKVKPF